MLGRGLIAIVSLGLSGALSGCEIDSAGLRVTTSPEGGSGVPDAHAVIDAAFEAGPRPDASDELDAPGSRDAGELLDAGSCEPTAEICNGRDDDCDGELDEACPCDVVAGDGGSVYLVCTDSPRAWGAARDACRAVDGFDLVMIGSAAEDGLVWREASARDAAAFWIGLYEPMPGVYAWVDGTEVWNAGPRGAYHNFAGGSPGFSVPNDCGQLDPGEAGAWTEGHCHDDDLPYVCERL